MDSSSPAFLPRICIAERVAVEARAAVRVARHFDVGRKFISMVRMPRPSQMGQRPPPVLNEKRAAVQPRGFRGCRGDRLRTSSQAS